jgi:hypothetical protein
VPAAKLSAAAGALRRHSVQVSKRSEPTDVTVHAFGVHRRTMVYR